MSNFNFRLYGDQIYGFGSKYFNKYISPEINKEQFLQMFKEGKLQYDNIKIKEKIEIYPQITINSLDIKNISIDIPNEKEGNLNLNLNNVSCDLIISNITEEQIKNILLKERKNLVDSFIKTSIDKIKNKEQSKSFLESLLDNLINQALNGLNIHISNLKLNIRYKHTSLLLIINDFLLDAKGRIIFNKIFASYNENSIEYTIIKEFDINIILSKNNNTNVLQINISDFTLELNQKIYFGFLNIINCLSDSSYQKLYYKYKTLIQFHRIKPLPDGKKNYKSLWLYAIRTIIKLQKYIGYNKTNIFNLLNSTQEKIAKKYYNNRDTEKNQENEINMIYLNKLNLLKYSKENVKKKLLDDKKGNSLANAFSFFFGGNKEKKEELTQDEIDNINKVYTEENIINFLKEYESINLEDNIIIAKIKKIYANLIMYINIRKLELILSNQNSDKNCDFYLSNINMEISHMNNIYNYKLFIFDICMNNNISIFKQKQTNADAMVKIGKYLNNLAINFSFFNIELQEDDFIYLLSFLYSIETPKRIRLFKPEEKENINKNNNTNNINKETANNKVFKDVKINHVPSLTLLCKGNKIDIAFNDFLLSETYFCFTLNIKDSFGEIFPDYTFMVNTIKHNNTYKFHLDMPIKFTLCKNSSNFFFLLYLKLQKVKEENKKLSNNNNIYNNENEHLFEFRYTSYFRLNMDDVNNIGLDFLIDKTEIEIYEEKCKSSLLINNFSVKYENKNININIGKLSLSTDKYSTIVLYLFTFESPDYKEYEQILSKYFPKLNNANNSTGNQNITEENNNNDNIAIIESIDYINIFETLFNNFNMNLKLFNFKYKAGNNITTLTLNNIQAEKNNKIFNISLQNCFIDLNIITPVKRTSTINLTKVGNIETILNIKEKITIDIDLATGIINIIINNPIADINMPIIQALDESFTFLIKQINLDYVICKFILDIKNTKISFNQFNYLIESINLKNFTKVTQDTFFFKIRNIIMRNNNIEIIEEKAIDFDYQFKTSTENVITFKSKDIKIKLTLVFLTSTINLQMT